MPLSPEDLRHIAARTVGHYDERALSYWEGTRDHDVSQNVKAFLSALRGSPPFDLLDLGCGPGRGQFFVFQARNSCAGHHSPCSGAWIGCP